MAPMIGSWQPLLFLAASWQWALETFGDPQHMVQIGAVIAVATIFLLVRAKH